MNNDIVKNEERSLVKDTEGANMVEYLILCGIVALMAVVAWEAFGSSVQDKIDEEGSNVAAIQGG